MQLSSLTSTQQTALLNEAERALAMESLEAFCRRSCPGYLTSAHTQAVIAQLESLERREITRLAIFMPPRHSKTFHCSERFPAWCLGRNPTQSVISVGYNQDLANGVSRKVRDLIAAEEYPFHGVCIRDDNRSVEQWGLDDGGLYIAAGVGGSLTGRGAHLLVLDDVIKSREDIDSLAKRDRMFEWYAEVASTRLMPGSVQLLVTTRWSDDDIAARIVASSDEWTVLRLPAIAGDDDVLGRTRGEALWPAFFPIESLEQKRAEMPARSWQALYQQDPAPADGTIIKAQWLQYRYDALPMIETTIPAERSIASWLPGLPGTRKIVQYPPHILQAVDASWGTGTSSDYSVIATVAFDNKDFYVLDVWRGRVPHPELTRMIELKFNEHCPRVVVVEAAQAGHAVIQSLKLLNRIPVVGVPPRSSKEARLEAITPLFESGRVLFPRNALWLPIVIDEFLRFPNATHDDTVDAIVYAIAGLWDGLKFTLSEGVRIMPLIAAASRAS